MSTPEHMILREIAVRQRPFLKNFDRLMSYGGIKPGYSWGKEDTEGLRFERSRRGLLRLALIQFPKYVDFDFVVNPFMKGINARHAGLVELVLFSRAVGKDVSGFPINAYGESYGLRNYSSIRWFTPRLDRTENGERQLSSVQPFRGMSENEAMLVILGQKGKKGKKEGVES